MVTSERDARKRGRSEGGRGGPTRGGDRLPGARARPGRGVPQACALRACGDRMRVGVTWPPSGVGVVGGVTLVILVTLL